MVLGSNLGRDKNFFLFGAGYPSSYSDNSTTWVVLGSNLGRDKIFFSFLRHGSMVHIMIILLAGWSWVQILVGTKMFLLFAAG